MGVISATKRSGARATSSRCSENPVLQRWDELTAPMSMREVEPGVSLVMDDAKLEDGPAWQAAASRPTRRKNHELHSSR